MSLKLTVFFEVPFWVGVFERQVGEELSVVRVVFGAEPTNPELGEFISENFHRLRFSDPVSAEQVEKPRGSPKRRQREARRATETQGVSQKANDAMRLELEKRAKVRDEKSKEQRESEEKMLFEKHQLKLKKKRRGH